jgi:Ras family protein A
MQAVYMECSSKERIGVDDIFDQAIILATNEDDMYEAHAQGGVKSMAKSRRKRMKKSCTIL